MFWLKSSSSPARTSRDRETSSPCAPWWRSPGCCAQPLTTKGPLRQECRDAGQHKAAVQETDGAPDVIGHGRSTIAENRPLPQHAAVNVGAAEPDAEGAGERGLGHAGVGAGGERAVAEGSKERTVRPSRDGRDGEHGEPRGQEVGEIVQPGGGPAELRVR